MNENQNLSLSPAISTDITIALIRSFLLLSLSLSLPFYLSFFIPVQAQLTDPLDYEALKNFIKEHNIQSTEQLMKDLPETYKENFVLIHESKSTGTGKGQMATKRNPRVLLFGRDAKTILAINGQGLGNQTLEIIQYDETTKKNRMYEINFNKKDDSGHPHFSGENPQSCVNCHTSGRKKGESVDPKVNWEHYPHWPGTFGEFEGGYAREYLREKKNYLKSFLKHRKDHPLYSQLKIPDFSTEKEYYDHFNGHNIDFTARVSQWNFQRVAEHMKGRNTLLPGLLYFLLDCADMENFLRQEVPLEQVNQRYLEALSHVLPESLLPAELYDQEYLKKHLQPEDFYDSLNADSAAANSAHVQIFANGNVLKTYFDLFNVDVSNWFMNFKPGLQIRGEINKKTYSFNVPNDPGTHFAYALAEAFPEESEIWNLMNRNSSRMTLDVPRKDRPLVCEKLRQESLQRIGQTLPNEGICPRISKAVSTLGEFIRDNSRILAATGMTLGVGAALFSIGGF